MKLTLLAGLLLAVIIRPAAAQSRLTGKILDAATGQPIPYASISVLSTTAGTTSNAEGEFELKAALPGRLVISELGHRRDTVAVAAATAPLLVRLQPASVLLPEVQVGSYLGDLIAQAYRQLRRTTAKKMYGQAFYRQITRIANDATEVQEMVWDAATTNAGMDGSAIVTGRFAKKMKAQISFNNFSVFTKRFGFNMKDDSLTQRGILGLNTARFYTLSLLGVTQSEGQQLVEIGFESKPGLAPLTAKGTLVINETTRQVLHLRFETPDLVNVKTNSLVVKLKDQHSVFEMDFQPAPNAAVLTYIKVDYRASLAVPLQRNVAIQASSFTYFYNSRATPDASVTYAPAKGGEVDLALIKQTTYDPAFWQNNAVVKRTPLEEQVMKSFEQKGAFGTMLP
ncbi:carboxypeptidase-like regulatory domain-containing protein [Hymenobacter siberiensis]|uniref:carboxypeptidase-like regulatory domain-containing protein n=1 Tax=Hymenobacter siberiensis TaxID=2848396 RepID=UPI001C1E3423|nr:carboxypeptidase-like regulatory domain-containing protein [Hymenobacter siberiensis]